MKRSLALALAAVGCVQWADSFATYGLVEGGAGAYAGALVCIDANQNARCDADEASTRTDGLGRYALRGSGPLAAEIEPGLVFRAPAGAEVLSPISTELVAAGEVANAGGAAASRMLAARVGVTEAQLAEDFGAERDPAVRARLATEAQLAAIRIEDAVADARLRGALDLPAVLRNWLAVDQIQNVVVIYLENRSFDNLFGLFPNANGLQKEDASIEQVDRDGVTPLDWLPPAWGGLTAPGQAPVVTEKQTTNVWPNAPFQIDDRVPHFGYAPLFNDAITRDLYHRFFENIMQIDGGKNDQFVAWADSGGLVMGYFDGRGTELWELAKHYTLADDFFQGAYGGSFLNHQYLVCACAPTVSAAFAKDAGASISVLGAPRNGVPQLVPGPTQDASAMSGPTSFALSGNLAPLDYFGLGDGYRAVNTMQPPYQPSGVAPADASHPLYADPQRANTLEPQTQTTIGAELDEKGVTWAWYAGGWAAAVKQPWNGAGKGAKSTTIYNWHPDTKTSDAQFPAFQPHHQPFNYYAAFDPVRHPEARTLHLRDRSDFLRDANDAKLPQVAFYKPVGFQNEHPGYANLWSGDREIKEVVAALRASPQWPHMLVVITFDEFGGQFDHAAPPKGDLLGPGTRVPAVIVSPFAKRGEIDHTPYDTGSILRFLAHRFSLVPLPGLTARDAALVANGGVRMGWLGGALELGRSGDARD